MSRICLLKRYFSSCLRTPVKVEIAHTDMIGILLPTTISLMFFKQECLFRSNTFVQVRMHMWKAAIECSCIHCEHFWKTCPFCRTRCMTLRCSSRYREHIHPYGCRRFPFYFPIGSNDEPWCPFTEPQIEVRPPERRTLEQIVQDP